MIIFYFTYIFKFVLDIDESDNEVRSTSDSQTNVEDSNCLHENENSKTTDSLGEVDEIISLEEPDSEHDSSSEDLSN